MQFNEGVSNGMTSIEIFPLSDAIGAEIRGIDLRKPLTEESIRIVKQAWFDHLIVLFRDQKLTYEQQKAFATHFGEVAKRGGDRGSPQEKAAGEGVMLVTNIREKGKPIGTLPDGETTSPAAASGLTSSVMNRSALPSRASFAAFVAHSWRWFRREAWGFARTLWRGPE